MTHSHIRNFRSLMLAAAAFFVASQVQAQTAVDPKSDAAAPMTTAPATGATAAPGTSAPLSTDDASKMPPAAGGASPGTADVGSMAPASGSTDPAASGQTATDPAATHKSKKARNKQRKQY